jgi:hypothetical protein
MELTKTIRIAETLDKLMTMDIPARGVIDALYKAARNREGRPLTLAAVELLTKKIKPGDTVIIATGWVDQPLVAPNCGESDGPPGTIALARAIRLALKATPIIVTDECLVEGLKRVARAGGFQCVSPDNLIYSIEKNKLLTASVLSLPAEETAAQQQARHIMETIKPSVCISIERGGMNRAGKIHNMGGYDTSDSMAKMDFLFREAKERGIATMAIGDGGNEIGMANIADDVREHVPYGKLCQCSCGLGIAPSTVVDVLVTSAVSNWGAYAVAALLGLATGTIAAVNDAEKEDRVLRGTADAGFHDPIQGAVVPSADGCLAEVHLAMVTLLREAVLRGDERY